jgi:FlaA1/EpsC-like NDP-sugar epimerase
MASIHWMYRIAKVGIDLTLLTAAFCLAFLARFEGNIPAEWLPVFRNSLPLVLFVQFAALQFLGTHRLAWRSVSLIEVAILIRALAVGTIILAFIRFGVQALTPMAPGLQSYLIPFGVLFIDFALAAFAMIGIRVLWRTRLERHARRIPGRRPVRTLLIGTGPASIRVVRDLASRPHTDIELVGIVAEVHAKVGMMMSGLPVVGTMQTLDRLAQEHDIEQAIVVPPDDGVQVRKLVRDCEAAGVKPRMMDDVVGSDERLDLARLRAVTVEDLLRRAPIRLEGDEVASLIAGRRVLVTGAGGSIGSQLCREICRFEPGELLLVEQAENSLFDIHRQLLRQHGRKLKIVPLLGDICDAARMRGLFERHRPEVLFHAAAHKHVPMMECNVREAIKNNVLGTQGLADLADQFGVGRFVMVSTDKAVRPTSIMGASKRIAELYVQALADFSKTCFVTVRFGNVLGSSGSVLPIFREQIASGGPVTVTHPDMRRYFMTIPEACQLILEAGSLGRGGEIFILDMGQSVRILDLARDMIRLAGLEPERDIEIRFSGIRPGEKLYEELSLDEENATRTRHPRIYIGNKMPCALSELRTQLDELNRRADLGDDEAMREMFREIVPEYGQPAPEPMPEPAPEPMLDGALPATQPVIAAATP